MEDFCGIKIPEIIYKKNFNNNNNKSLRLYFERHSKIN